MRNIRHLTCVILIAMASGAQAQSSGPDTKAAQVAAPLAAEAKPKTEGEIRKVDKDQGKITIKHAPILNLDMPGMTMVFRASDPKALEMLKAGDKVRFSAEKVNGVLTVTAIETVK